MKSLWKSTVWEINNESEAHPRLAADRLEPAMRTWCQRLGRVGAVSEGRPVTGPGKGGGGGRGVTPPATPILHPVQGLGVERGRVESSPHPFYMGCRCEMPPPHPLKNA